MPNRFRLLTTVAVASLITMGGYFALALVLAALLEKPSVPRGAQAAGVAVTVLLPIGTAAWWMFRRLRSSYTKREALAAAITYGLVTPVSSAVAVLLAQIPGSYADLVLGYRFFGLVGAFVGMVFITALLGFLACALVLLITRRLSAAGSMGIVQNG